MSDGRFVIKVGDLPGSPEYMDDDEKWDKASAGYVEVPGGPTCGNCGYLKDRRCVHPPAVVSEMGAVAKFGFLVDVERGCCSFWEANPESEEAATDFARDARREADEA